MISPSHADLFFLSVFTKTTGRFRVWESSRNSCDLWWSQHSLSPRPLIPPPPVRERTCWPSRTWTVFLFRAGCCNHITHPEVTWEWVWSAHTHTHTRCLYFKSLLQTHFYKTCFHEMLCFISFNFIVILLLLCFHMFLVWTPPWSRPERGCLDPYCHFSYIYFSCFVVVIVHESNCSYC